MFPQAGGCSLRGASKGYQHPNDAGPTRSEERMLPQAGRCSLRGVHAGWHPPNGAGPIGWGDGKFPRACGHGLRSASRMMVPKRRGARRPGRWDVPRGLWSPPMEHPWGIVASKWRRAHGPGEWGFP